MHAERLVYPVAKALAKLAACHLKVYENERKVTIVSSSREPSKVNRLLLQRL